MRKPESRAIAILARVVIHDTARDALFHRYEWPDIGDDGWRTILEKIELLTPEPDRADVQFAYDVLKARAERSAPDPLTR